MAWQFNTPGIRRRCGSLELVDYRGWQIAPVENTAHLKDDTIWRSYDQVNTTEPASR